MQEIISTEAELAKANNGLPVIVNMVPEPFLNPFAHTRGGAYPHDPARPVKPGSPDITFEVDQSMSLGEPRLLNSSYIVPFRFDRLLPPFFRAR